MAFYVGSGGTGTLNIGNGGSVSSGLAAYAGFNAGSTGTVNITNGSLGADALYFGFRGQGVLNLAGTGSVTAPTVGVGTIAGSSGTLNIGTGGEAGSLVSTLVIGGAGSAVVNFNHTNNLTFTPRLDGSLSVNKLGSGTATLTGSNSYTGGTHVQNGVWRAGSASALSQNTRYQVDGGTLDLNGFNLTATDFSGAGGLVALGAGTLTVDQIVGTTYAGGITGTGGLTLKGSGELTLTGTNNYSGATRVEGSSTLTIGGTNFSGTSALTVEAGSAVLVGTNFASFPAVAFGSIAGDGYIYDNSIISGFAWGSDNTSTTFGGTMVEPSSGSKLGTGDDLHRFRQRHPPDDRNSGGIKIGTGGALGNTAVSMFGSTNTSATLDLDGNNLAINSLIGTANSFVTLGSGTLTLNGTTAVPTTFSGVISGGGGLVKNGGTYALTLDGDNTFTGKTIINAGTLRIGTSGTAPAVAAWRAHRNHATHFSRTTTAAAGDRNGLHSNSRARAARGNNLQTTTISLAHAGLGSNNNQHGP